jgi:hypothetical protein
LENRKIPAVVRFSAKVQLELQLGGGIAGLKNR